MCLALALAADVLAVPAPPIDAAGSAALSRAFAACDRNGDGQLTPDEWIPRAADVVALTEHAGVSFDRFARSFLELGPGPPADESLYTDRAVKECEGLLANGLIERAVECSKETVRRHPLCGPAWSALARALERMGLLAGARRAYERSLELAPGDVKVRVSWAQSCARAGNESQARASADQALGAIVTRLALWGHGLRREAEIGFAEQHLLMLVHGYLHVTRRLSRAAELIQRGLQLLGNRPRLVAADLERRFLQGERETLLDAVGSALTSDGGDARFWLLAFRGRVLSALGRQAEAAAGLREALSHPATPAEHQQASLDLYVALAKDGQAARAAELLRTRLLPDATSPASKRHLARYLAEAGRLDEAVAELRAALAASAADPTIWKELAELLSQKDDGAGRDQALAEALERCGERRELARELRERLAYYPPPPEDSQGE
jgi:predicted Zn-dependent protease